jgi:hypothetical protein
MSPTVAVQSGPRNARTDPESGLRYYRWLDEEYPSVTSIRRMAGLPFGLHNWAIGEVANHAVDNVFLHADRLKRAYEYGTADTTTDEQDARVTAEMALIKSELRRAATAKRDMAAELGTAVHDAAASDLAPEDVREDLRPRLSQYLDWARVASPAIIGTEFQVWNLSVGYAGTVDLLCQLSDGSVWLVDLKTGGGVYADHVIQIAAYAHAEFVGEDNVRDEWLTDWLRQISGTAVLHLADDGWEFIALPRDDGAWHAFRGLLEFARWSRDHAAVETFTLARKAGAAA